MQYRPVVPPATVLVRRLLIALSLFHFYTAGFGLLSEATDRGAHLAFVLGLISVIAPGLYRLRPGRTQFPGPAQACWRVGMQAGRPRSACLARPCLACSVALRWPTQ